MITINTNIKTLAICATGHADFSTKGTDIVCAAVSILMYSYAAELLRLGVNTDISDDGCRFEIRTGRKTIRAMVAYETVMSGLRMIADEYGNSVQINEEAKWQRH